MTDIHNLPSDYERRLSDTIGTLCLVGAVVYTRHHRQGHDTGHNMSKRCQTNTKDVATDRHRTQHVERDVRRTQKMLRWTDTGHNMSKRCQTNTKDVATDMRQDTTCRKRCQTNTKDVAMDRHRTQHVERDVRRT